VTAIAEWRLYQRGAIYLARHAGQPRSEIRAMPMRTFRAWVTETSAALDVELGG